MSSNTFGGGTTVNGGTLLANNTGGSATGTGAVTVTSGATLGGGGIVGGPVTVDGALAPGNNGVGTLTIGDNLVVDGGAMLQYELGTNSDLTAVAGNLTLGGTLNITDAGGFSLGEYLLFTYGGALTYNGVTIGTAPSGYQYLIDTNTAGQVKLNVALVPSTITMDTGYLYDRFGNLMPTSSIVVLVVDVGTNGFVDPQPAFPLSLGATWGTEDRIVGRWDLTGCSDCGAGYLYDQTVVAYANGIAPGQKLQMYWFPSLTLASNTVGVTYYGKYRDTNNPPLDGGDAWQMPAGGSSAYLAFYTVAAGGSSPETRGLASFQTTIPPSAAFTAWQMQYFGCTNCPQAAANADPLGKGMSNTNQFLAGLNPTNSHSVFRITSVTPQNKDVMITWTTAGGITNAVQAVVAGGYTTNFADISAPIVVLGSGDTATNYLDLGGATNWPARFYRVRLVP